jgi:hypothetical protein
VSEPEPGCQGDARDDALALEQETPHLAERATPFTGPLTSL